MKVIVTNDVAQIRSLITEGFCPVECSIGGESYVDALKMDHHGALSSLEGVAIRAYRDHFGARKDDPRFVIVGHADGDASFAVAALAGLLPHPRFDVSSLPPFLHAHFQRDILAIAQAVNAMDVDPIGTPADLPEVGYTALFHKISPSNHLSLGGEGAVQLWKNLTTGQDLAPFVEQATRQFVLDDQLARAEFDLRGSEVGRIGIVEGSTLWGFRAWYNRNQEIKDPTEILAWRRPVVLSHQAQDKNVTIGCPSVEIAEKLFGPGGLKNVFPKLDAIAEGWGGREAIGGSPRGREMAPAELRQCVTVVAEAMQIGAYEVSDLLQAAKAHKEAHGTWPSCLTHPRGNLSE